MPPGAEAHLIKYTTTDETGAQHVATATVLVPTAKADGPRPVLAWAHGTSGLQQACLPSLAPDTSLWGKMSDGINAIAWGSGFGAVACDATSDCTWGAVAQATARELGPKNIHVAHLIIDSGVDTEWVRQRREQMWGKEALDNPDLLMPPASVAESYWQLYQQPRTAWTFELEIRPFGEKW